MPLSNASIGEKMLVIRVKSADVKLRKHLENLGIISGVELTPLMLTDGNMIVRVHDARIAIDRDVAENIVVTKCPVVA